MCLPDSLEDLGLNLLGDLVSHDGLELWLLQADVWEKEALVVWVQLPHYCVLGTKGKKIPLPDWYWVYHSILYLLAMASQIVHVSHEDHLTLPLGVD